MNNFCLPPISNQGQYPLIERTNNYNAIRKLVSIHSCDRDFAIYPNASNFEIVLPQSLKNIVSIRMVEGNFPNTNYNFSNLRQNSKFRFQITSGASQGTYEATLTDGFYNPSQLANAVGESMNLAVDPNGTYTKFKCSYNLVEFKLYFGNTEDNFILLFNEPSYYNIPCVDISANLFEKTTDWGFGYYLGFNKEQYTTTAVNSTNGYRFNYANPTVYWLEPATPPGPVYYTSPPLVSTFLGSGNIYMEIERFNNIDETEHDQKNTNSTFGNGRYSRVNGCFATIPIFQTPPGQSYDAVTGLYQNYYMFNTPEERIERLKFKFRDHNNYPINFQIFHFLLH